MQFDKDGDGLLNLEEFSASPLVENAPSPEAIQQRFDQVDTDGDGHLSMEELRAAMERARSSGGGDDAPPRAMAGEGVDTNPMERLDTDGDGFISFEEFLAGPGAQSDGEEARRRFDRIDSDEDGKLSADEVRAFFQNRQQP